MYLYIFNTYGTGGHYRSLPLVRGGQPALTARAALFAAQFDLKKKNRIKSAETIAAVPTFSLQIAILFRHTPTV